MYSHTLGFSDSFTRLLAIQRRSPSVPVAFGPLAPRFSNACGLATAEPSVEAVRGKRTTLLRPGAYMYHAAPMDHNVHGVSCRHLRCSRLSRQGAGRNLCSASEVAELKTPNGRPEHSGSTQIETAQFSTSQISMSSQCNSIRSPKSDSYPRSSKDGASIDQLLYNITRLRTLLCHHTRSSRSSS
jgi:hypothetical protein